MSTRLLVVLIFTAAYLCVTVYALRRFKNASRVLANLIWLAEAAVTLEDWTPPLIAALRRQVQGIPVGLIVYGCMVLIFSVWSLRCR